MTDSVGETVGHGGSAIDHVQRADPLATAREMINRLGQNALGRAIDYEFEASARGNRSAAAFWGRACFAVVQLLLVGTGEPPASSGGAGGTLV